MHGFSPPSRTSVSTLLVAFVLALWVIACGNSAGPASPSRPLPSYAGRAVDLYDDSIEPAAVGLDYQKGYSPRSDAMLRERTQISDAVLRVKVSTVTAKKDGPDATYQLGLHTAELMAGKHPPPVDFLVKVDKSSESLGILKNFESRLVGYSFVAFVREFVRPDGDAELHFHLAPDTKEVRAAISDALALQELK